jgi:hypothetical protein
VTLGSPEFAAVLDPAAAASDSNDAASILDIPFAHAIMPRTKRIHALKRPVSQNLRLHLGLNPMLMDV